MMLCFGLAFAEFTVAMRKLPCSTKKEMIGGWGGMEGGRGIRQEGREGGVIREDGGIGGKEGVKMQGFKCPYISYIFYIFSNFAYVFL